MIKITGLLGLSFLVLAGYSAWRIATLNQEIGASREACNTRVAALRAEGLQAVIDAKEEALQREIEVQRRHAQALERARQELERERALRTEAETAFDEELDTIVTDEVQQWYDTSLPQPVLHLD